MQWGYKMEILCNLILTAMIIVGAILLIKESPVIWGLFILGGVVDYTRHQIILAKFKEKNQ